MDFQVKIQGVRVEPDEVSATILQYSGVQACVVIALPDALQQLRLVAYVVGPGLSAEELRKVFEPRIACRDGADVVCVPGTHAA